MPHSRPTRLPLSGQARAPLPMSGLLRPALARVSHLGPLPRPNDRQRLCQLRHHQRQKQRRAFSQVAWSPPNDPRLTKGAKVVVSLSGGVDSSVALRLLAEYDLDLSAVFMRNWSVEEEDSLRGCEWERDWEDVRRVCSHVGGVPCELIDLSKEYWLDVFEPALDHWQRGLTPNPDIACNREIKFGALFNRVFPPTSGPSSSSSLAYSADGLLATGHYAQVGIPNLWQPGQSAELWRCPDPIKDQSYFLSAVDGRALSKTVFPLGHLHKAEVRELARRFDLPTADRRESMGICFVGNQQSASGFPDRFLSKYIAPSPGPVLTSTGAYLGSHTGLHSYTVGQKFRKAGLPEGSPRWFVAAKDRKNNALVVVPGADHSLLLSRTFLTTRWSWVARIPPAELSSEGGLAAGVKIMSVGQPLPAVLRSKPDGAVSVTFSDDGPGMAVTPGQICAVYVGERCLGGGEIVEREWSWDEGVVLETGAEAKPRRNKRALRRADKEQHMHQKAVQP